MAAIGILGSSSNVLFGRSWKWAELTLEVLHVEAAHDEVRCGLGRGGGRCDAVAQQ